ncbi:putative non-specific serine/threonine protein kinase [Medicago truncatula]|uniref:Putative non-specific serine/threonine protein kinase n=1 Tax=Medicago truncatula TaxID=3880 RepID=A0A396JUW0_MEDTR|nr:putative non-specific serine/threonine protein kinase [Medicago truncatula]
MVLLFIFFLHQFVHPCLPLIPLANNTHHCKWTGVTCRSNCVTTNKLPSSSLVGTIPISINILTKLTHLDLRNNSLTGPLPEFRPLLIVLHTVDLSHNNFTSVPYDCFRVMLGLRYLNISNNLNLIEWIFPDLSDPKLLHTIDFEATNLIASLPPDMFELFPSLDTIVLSHNNLSGLLPLSLGNSKVTCLRLSDQGEGVGFTGGITLITSMISLYSSFHKCMEKKFYKHLCIVVFTFQENGETERTNLHLFCDILK